MCPKPDPSNLKHRLRWPLASGVSTTDCRLPVEYPRRRRDRAADRARSHEVHAVPARVQRDPALVARVVEAWLARLRPLCVTTMTDFHEVPAYRAKPRGPAGPISITLNVSDSSPPPGGSREVPTAAQGPIPHPGANHRATMNERSRDNLTLRARSSPHTSTIPPRSRRRARRA